MRNIKQISFPTMLLLTLIAAYFTGYAWIRKDCKIHYNIYATSGFNPMDPKIVDSRIRIFPNYCAKIDKTLGIELTKTIYHPLFLLESYFTKVEFMYPILIF